MSNSLVRNAKTDVFISYHTNDAVIAEAVKMAIDEVTRDRLKCFLDLENIRLGEQWEEPLNQAVRDADWLVCIFTGDQSDYCGYEIGVFKEAHKAGPDHDPKTRLVCLHDVDAPIIFKNYQHKPLQLPPETVDKYFNEQDFYARSTIAQFLRDVCASRNLIPEGETHKFESRISEQAKKITEAFVAARKADRKWRKYLQLRMELRIKDGGGEFGEQFTGFPASTEVLADYSTLIMFNSKPPPGPEGPKTTWGLLRAAQSAISMTTTWMDKIERDAVEEAKGRCTKEPDITFQSGDRILRSVLARHEYYHDGSRRFVINFVETLPRQFLGKKNTSLLLAGLVLGSRFRFAYLEEGDNQYQSLFAENKDDEEFAVNCRQLVYDIERMEHESAEFGLLDRKAFIAAYGDDNRAFVEHFCSTWDVERAKLFAALNARESSPPDRPKIQSAIFAFFKKMKAQNAAFLMKSIEVYRAEMSNQLTHILSQAAKSESH